MTLAEVNKIREFHQYMRSGYRFWKEFEYSSPKWDGLQYKKGLYVIPGIVKFTDFETFKRAVESNMNSFNMRKAGFEGMYEC